MAETGGETHTTTTTRTTVVTTSSNSEVITIGCNVGFLKSILGILMLVEVILGLICWCLVVSYGTPIGAMGFSAFATIAGWLITLALFLVYLIGLHGTVCSSLPWGMIEIVINAVCALFFFIAACICASYGRVPNWGAAAAFAFVLTALYVISFLFSFRKSYNRFPWQPAPASAAP